MSKRATVYFEADLHRALRMKAAQADASVSQIVNAAVRRILSEDADDLAAFDDRAAEPSVDFSAMLKDMRRRGRL